MNIEISTGSSMCHRCGRPLLLSAKVPHEGWTNNLGKHVSGSRIVALCTTCDTHTPAGRVLIAFFAHHGQITEDNVHEAATLLHTWLEDITPPRLQDHEIEQVLNEWRNEQS